MKITEVVVSTGRTFNHPHENYSNLKPSLTIKATIEEGDNYEKVISELREKVEKTIEVDKARMIADIINLEEITRRNNEVLRLEKLIESSKGRLDQIKQGNLLENKPYLPEDDEQYR